MMLLLLIPYYEGNHTVAFDMNTGWSFLHGFRMVFPWILVNSLREIECVTLYIFVSVTLYVVSVLLFLNYVIVSLGR